jgi:hypothetical protein
MTRRQASRRTNAPSPARCPAPAWGAAPRTRPDPLPVCDGQEPLHHLGRSRAGIQRLIVPMTSPLEVMDRLFDPTRPLCHPPRLRTDPVSTLRTLEPLKARLAAYEHGRRVPGIVAHQRPPPTIWLQACRVLGSMGLPISRMGNPELCPQDRGVCCERIVVVPRLSRRPAA